MKKVIKKKVIKAAFSHLIVTISVSIWTFGIFCQQTPSALAPSGPFLDYTHIANVQTYDIATKKTSPAAFEITNMAKPSVFLTSSVGKGFQAELKTSYQGTQVSMNNSSTRRLLECQQPFGNPACCVKSCQALPVQSIYSTPPTLFNSCEGVITAIANPSIPYLQGTDLLNEIGWNDTNLSYVYLDTIINNSALATDQYNPTSFSIATTNAPLFKNTGGGTSDPTTLVGALQMGNFSTVKNIFPNVSKPTVPFQLGTAQYTLNFLSNPDNRYTIFAPAQHNPANQQLAYKYHMADPNLALNTDPVKGIQTIILYPTDLETSCQPVIYIGKDYTTGSLLALTYFTSNYTLPDKTPCCWTGQLCQQDVAYFTSLNASPTQFGGTSIAINPNNTTKSLGGSAENLTLNPGRMRLIIDNVPHWTIGYASHLDVLPGLYWPGQSDFLAPAVSQPPC